LHAVACKFRTLEKKHMPEFKVGDVVQLKSGGPKMTIVGPGNRNLGQHETHYSCTWFKDDTPEFQSFPKDALQKGDDTNPNISVLPR
jgi:uncharacterized protein YodC (DUF2158 family)